jgi:hypothetical protein
LGWRRLLPESGGAGIWGLHGSGSGQAAGNNGEEEKMMNQRKDMKLSNLEREIADGVDRDLGASRRLASARGRDFPDLRLRLVALDREHDPQPVPRHRIERPAASAPATLAARCDWQKLRDSFEIVTTAGATWVIGGGSTGVMYGVNEAIACRTGLIWASQDENEAVFGPVRDLPAGPQIPRIAYRGIYGGDPDWFGRQRLNFRMMGARHWAAQSGTERATALAGARQRGIHPTLSEHAMDTYLPEDILRTHPDWMGWRNGQRCLRDTVDLPECPRLRAALPIQPCYANAEVRDFITSRMAALLDATPDVDFFGVWPHDGVNNWCQCDACRTVSPFEHMYALARDLQAKLKRSPALELIAYSNMLNLPRAPLLPSENVYAFFCAYLRGFRHRIFDPGGPDRVMTGVNYPAPDRINPVDEREYGRIFENWLPYWREAGIVPAVFEYSGAFPDETGRMDHQRYLHIPAPQLREDEACWYAARGVGLAILCGRHGEWPDAFPDLAWAHSLWGNEPMAALRQRYYAALGGTHGGQLADAVDNLSAALKASDDVPEQALRDLDDVLSLLPDSPQAIRYRDWMDYIRLGRKAWNLLLAGDAAASANAEVEIRKLIEARADRIPVAELLLERSRHFEKRARERVAGHAGKDYVL